MALLNVTDFDRAYYEENLKPFLPETFIDCHAHIWLEEFHRKQAWGTRSQLWPRLVARDNSLEDLEEGMVLTGTVRNVTDFGAFVDIGVHQDGLVHISQISNKFIKHPSELLSVGDIVKVVVLEVDEKKHRISLSMKQVKE